MTTTPGLDPLLTIEEVADYLNITVRTLARWREANTGPAYHRLGRQVRYRQSELESYLNNTLVSHS